MNLRISLLASVLALGTISTSFALPLGMCTREYMPVCASVQVQCIKAPCYPVYQTFSNRCEMKANTNATFIKEGACGTDEGAPVILSEGMKTGLMAQYNAFLTRISTLDKKSHIASLQALKARIDARVKSLDAMNSLESSRKDLLNAALNFLGTLVANDIRSLQNPVVGIR